MVKVKIFPANVDRTLYTGDGIIIVDLMCLCH